MPRPRVISLDRDLLAVRYTRHNAALNGALNVTPIGSVGSPFNGRFNGQGHTISGLNIAPNLTGLNSIGLFAAILLLLVARAAIWRVALGATLGMVAVWLFFGLALGVRLPTGEFWQPVTALFYSAPPPSEEQ